jgi:RNA polymerase sigma-70 factor, ECF subfamily
MNNTVLTKNQFEDFYDECFNEFLGFTILRIGDRNIAIDLCQEAFIKTLEILQNGEHIQSPHAYIYRILKNKIIDYYRKKKSLSLDQLTDDGFDTPGTHPESDNLYYARIVKKLEELPDTYRDAVIMRFVMELSPGEIADRLQISENVVSVRIYRGREIAQKILEDFVIHQE